MLRSDESKDENESKTGNKDGLNKDIWNEKKCPIYKVDRDKETKEKYIELRTGRNETTCVYSGRKVLMKPLRNGQGELFYRKKVNNKIVKCAKVAAEIKAYEEKGGKNFELDYLLEDCYLVLGEENWNKHHESVFCKGEKLELEEKDIQLAMAGLEETVKIYGNSAINRNLEEGKLWYPSYYRMKEEGCIPVWYKYLKVKKEEILYLSMASIGRKAYHTTMNDLVNKKQPCKLRKEMCEACRLFGMAGKKEAVGSRIRFTDAVYTSSEYKKEEVTLTELGSPRTSYMPFYANVAEDKFGAKNKLGYDAGTIGIRGRKFYWHSKNWKQVNSNIEGNNRNATVELFETKGENNAFEFKVYFDEITKEELKKLIFSLNFWENKKDGDMCHKIGHGKPIGLGSIKITVDDICQRTFSEKEGYKVDSIMENYTKGSKENFKIEDIPFNVSDKSNETVQSLLKICNFKNTIDTCYPYVEKQNGLKGEINDFASHQWFKENMSAGLRGHDHKLQYLPKILDKNQGLKVYKAELKTIK